MIPVVVGVGNQAKQFNMLFDTGSVDFWLSSVLLPLDEDGVHNFYNPVGSTSAVQVDGTWSIIYGGGGSSASGIVFGDTIDIGVIVIANQAVEAARQVSSGNI